MMSVSPMRPGARRRTAAAAKRPQHQPQREALAGRPDGQALGGCRPDHERGEVDLEDGGAPASALRHRLFSTAPDFLSTSRASSWDRSARRSSPWKVKKPSNVMRKISSPNSHNGVIAYTLPLDWRTTIPFAVRFTIAIGSSSATEGSRNTTDH